MVLELYCEVAIRYLKMGAGQFLRDFRKDYQLQKTFAHRKSLMQKKEQANKKKLKVHIPQIEHDTSKGKKLSHLRLQALVAKLNAEGLRNLYQKKELQKLCDAYNVRYLSRWNKGKLANDLAQAILQNEAIPAPQVLSFYRSELSGEDHVNSVPVIRLGVYVMVLPRSLLLANLLMIK